MPDATVRAVYSLAVLACLYVSFSSSALLGPGVRGAAGGLFSASGSLLSPAEPAFVIWMLLYLGLFGLAIRSWTPGAGARQRQRAVLPAATVSVVADTAWMLCATRGFAWATLPLILISLGAVVWVQEAVRNLPPPDAIARVLVEGTFGVCLGWLLAAASANLLILTRMLGWAADGTAASALAVTLLAVVVVAGGAALFRYRLNWGIPAGLAWALVWIVRARTHGGPVSPLVEALAILAVLAVTVGPLLAIGLRATPWARGLDARPASGVVPSARAVIAESPDPTRARPTSRARALVAAPVVGVAVALACVLAVMM